MGTMKLFTITIFTFCSLISSVIFADDDPNIIEAQYTNYFYSSGIKRDSDEGKELFSRHEELSLDSMRKLDYFAAYLRNVFDVQRAYNKNVQDVYVRWAKLKEKYHGNETFNKWYSKEEEIFDKYDFYARIEGGLANAIVTLQKKIDDTKSKDNIKPNRSIPITIMYGEMTELMVQYMEYWRLKNATLIEPSLILHTIEQNDKNKIIGMIKKEVMPLYIDEIKLKVYLDVYFDMALKVNKAVAQSIVKLVEFDLGMLDVSIEQLKKTIGSLGQSIEANKKDADEKYFSVLVESKKYYEEMISEVLKAKKIRMKFIEEMKISRVQPPMIILPYLSAPAGLGGWLKDKMNSAYEGAKGAASSVADNVSYGAGIIKDTVDGTVKDIKDNAGYAVEAAGMTIKDITGVKETDDVSIKNIGKAVLTTGVNVIKATYEGADLITKAAAAATYEGSASSALSETKKAFEAAGNKGVEGMGREGIQSAVNGLEAADKQVQKTLGPVGKFIFDATPIGGGLGMGKDFSTLMDDRKSGADKAVAAVSLGLSFIGTSGAREGVKSAANGIKGAVKETADEVGKSMAKKEAAKDAADKAAKSFWEKIFSGGKADYSDVTKARENLKTVSDQVKGEVKDSLADGISKSGSAISEGIGKFKSETAKSIESLFTNPMDSVKDMFGSNGMDKFKDFWQGQLEGAAVKDIFGLGVGTNDFSDNPTTIQNIITGIVGGNALGDVPGLLSDAAGGAMDFINNMDSQFDNWWNNNTASGGNNDNNDKGAYDYANSRASASAQQSKQYTDIANQTGSQGSGSGFTSSQMSGVTASSMANMMSTQSQASWNAVQEEKQKRQQQQQSSSGSSNSSGSGATSTCPFVFVRTSSKGFEVDNDIISVAKWNTSNKTNPDDVAYMDNYLLKYNPANIKNSYEIKIKEVRDEKSFIDYVSLYAVDVPDRYNIAVDRDAKPYRYKNLKPVDDAEYILFNGDSLTLNLDDYDNNRKSLVLFINVKGFIHYDTMMSTPVPIQPKILLQVLKDNEWKTVDYVYPRQNDCITALNLSEELNDNDNGLMVRLVSVSCLTNVAHKIKIMGLGQTPVMSIVPKKLVLRKASFNGKDVKDAISDKDGDDLILMPLNEIELSYNAPILKRGFKRYFLLKTFGSYQSLEGYTVAQGDFVK